MKGIILAGGNGTRLFPLTLSTSKQLLPVYDKPLIYYPLSILMLAGIKEILIISTPNDLPNMERLLGDGSSFGISLSYLEQPKPDGIAKAFVIGKEFINDEPVTLILGDNIFYGAGLIEMLKNAVSKATNNDEATIFSYYVDNPNAFGVIKFDDKKPVKIIEKPEQFVSNFAVTGLYVYPKGVCNIVDSISYSPRGELEITDLNNLYINKGSLNVTQLGRGYTWFDVGTINNLANASEYIKAIQDRLKLILYCPEEIAFNNKWISKEMLVEAANKMKANYYGEYLFKVSEGKITH